MSANNLHSTTTLSVCALQKREESQKLYSTDFHYITRNALCFSLLHHSATLDIQVLVPYKQSQAIHF